MAIREERAKTDEDPQVHGGLGLMELSFYLTVTKKPWCGATQIGQRERRQESLQVQGSWSLVDARGTLGVGLKVCLRNPVEKRTGMALRPPPRKHCSYEVFLRDFVVLCGLMFARTAAQLEPLD